MEIYTSNYSRAKNFNPEHYVMVSISRTRPLNNTMPVIPAFMPSADLIAMWKSGRINWEQFEEIYRDEIGYVDIREELDFLRYMTKGRDVVILSSEGKGKPSHRRILADIINEQYGYDVREI